MTKVIVTDKRKRTLTTTTSVPKKRVTDNDGQKRTLYTLDFGSESFGGDFQYVFSRNVAKARRENKRITGSPDVVITKR
jgi:hypothetical protein